MSIIDKAWDLVSGTPDWAKKLLSQISGSEALKELRELRGEQEQLNMALAVRLLDLQKCTNEARSEAGEGLRIARRTEAAWDAKLQELDASSRQLAHVGSRVEEMVRQLDAAEARRAALMDDFGRRTGNLGRLVRAALIAIVVLALAVAWLAAKELA